MPYLFKQIVDTITGGEHADGTLMTICGSLLLGYGAARLGSVLFGELRNAVFASVAQKAIRDCARKTFEHLLKMDMSFHLQRETGALSRAIDRGIKYSSPLSTSPAPFISRK